MIRRHRSVMLAAVIVAAGIFISLYLRGLDIAVLNPQGIIAEQQRDLMVTATLLILIVVVPVFILTFGIVWKYREGNKKAKYTPDWDGHNGLEITWWAIPTIIISVLAVMIWKSSHDLDPFKALSSSKKPVTVQVVALQWKWLFIYPEQNIATINDLHIPEDTPINFEITADAPMNSFWIPKLGGQIYAMAGMTTKLHLMANEPGTYIGSSANLSGEGFSKMRFTATATSKADFDKWVADVKNDPRKLSMEEYTKIAKPTQDITSALYSSAENDLHSKIVMKYMKPVAEEGGEDAHNQSARQH